LDKDEVDMRPTKDAGLRLESSSPEVSSENLDGLSRMLDRAESDQKKGIKNEELGQQIQKTFFALMQSYFEAVDTSGVEVAVSSTVADLRKRTIAYLGFLYG
jgi:hypothetical protein